MVPPASHTELAPSVDPEVDWCTHDKPIIYSRLHDTVETINQIKPHNDAWVAACNKGKP